MGSAWLTEETCSMGSVKQGRGPRGALYSCCPGMFSGFHMTESRAWLDFSVDPAWSRRLDCSPSRGHLHSFWEWCSGIRSKWLGGLHGACIWCQAGMIDSPMGPTLKLLFLFSRVLSCVLQVAIFEAWLL